VSDPEKESSRIMGSYAAAVLAKDVDAFMRLYHPTVRVFDAWGIWLYDGAPAWYTVAGGVYQAGSLIGQYGSVPGYATAAFSEQHEGLSGVLRVTAPNRIGRAIVVPLAVRLMAENPLLQVNLTLTDGIMDIIHSLKFTGELQLQ